LGRPKDGRGKKEVLDIQERTNTTSPQKHKKRKVGCSLNPPGREAGPQQKRSRNRKTSGMTKERNGGAEQTKVGG